VRIKELKCRKRDRVLNQALPATQSWQQWRARCQNRLLLLLAQAGGRERGVEPMRAQQQLPQRDAELLARRMHGAHLAPARVRMVQAQPDWQRRLVRQAAAWVI